MLSVKREAVNTNFKVIGLTRLGIQLESTAPAADALITRPFEHISEEILQTCSFITKFHKIKYKKANCLIQVRYIFFFFMKKIKLLEIMWGLGIKSIRLYKFKINHFIKLYRSVNGTVIKETVLFEKTCQRDSVEQAGKFACCTLGKGTSRNSPIYVW